MLQRTLKTTEATAAMSNPPPSPLLLVLESYLSHTEPLTHKRKLKDHLILGQSRAQGDVSKVELKVLRAEDGTKRVY